MNQPTNKESIQKVESLVLSAMCQGTAEGSMRAEAARLLANYAWREAVHQATFECLSMIPTVQPEELRRALMACLTRKGFPDVDIEMFFHPHSLSKSDVESFIRQLVESR